MVITFGSYLLWFWLIRHYPATKLAAFTLLTPLFGLLAGALLLAEPITARLAIALAAVTLGIAVVNTPARSARRARSGRRGTLMRRAVPAQFLSRGCAPPGAVVE